MLIKNASRNIILAEKAEYADDFFSRAAGLLGRSSMSHNEALWIIPCGMIHTFFMRFDIDALFLDRRNRIVRIKRNIPPWRICYGGIKSHSVVEFAAGATAPDAAAPGDVIEAVESQK